MTPINPTVVQCPDGLVGCLVAREGLLGCVEFGTRRIVSAYPLITLSYHITLSNKETPSTPKYMRKV
jgi:hypothetical protein